jgi:outer membrane autotransporter protein
MNYSKENQDSLTTTLGLRGSWAFSADFGVIVPQVRAEWEHEFKRDAFVTSTSYREDADNFVFDVKSDSPDRNYFNLGGGVVAVLAHGWMPFIDYQGLVGDRDWSRHRVTVGIRKEFR